MKKTLLMSIAALVASSSLAYASCDDGEQVIKFSHVVSDKGHPKGDAAQAFASAVNEQMQGRFCVEVYPNSTLFNDNKVLEAMLLGDVQLAAPSLSKFEKYTKKFRVFDLPFLFNDAEAVYRFQDSADGAKMASSLDSYGLKLLGYWPNGMKQISANVPLVKPTDAAGLKFRVQPSDVMAALFKTLDASPQKMAFKEVYGALQTGVVDGQENAYSNIYKKKFFEVQDGVTESNHGVLTYGVVTSAEFWNGLNDSDRNELAAILAATTADARNKAAASNASAKQSILDAGGIIRILSDSERASWAKAMRPVWDQFEGDIGQDVIDAALASNN